MEVDQLESFCSYPGKRRWWAKVGTMRRELVVLQIQFFKYRANGISIWPACELYRKGRSTVRTRRDRGKKSRDDNRDDDSSVSF